MIYLIYMVNKNIVVVSQFILFQIISIGLNHIISSNIRR